MKLSEAKDGYVVAVDNLDEVAPERLNAIRDLGLYEGSVARIDGVDADGVHFHKDSGPLVVKIDDAAAIEIRRIA